MIEEGGKKYGKKESTAAANTYIQQAASTQHQWRIVFEVGALDKERERGIRIRLKVRLCMYVVEFLLAVLTSH